MQTNTPNHQRQPKQTGAMNLMCEFSSCNDSELHGHISFLQTQDTSWEPNPLDNAAPQDKNHQPEQHDQRRTSADRPPTTLGQCRHLGNGCCCKARICPHLHCRQHTRINQPDATVSQRITIALKCCPRPCTHRHHDHRIIA